MPQPDIQDILMEEQTIDEQARIADENNADDDSSNDDQGGDDDNSNNDNDSDQGSNSDDDNQGDDNDDQGDDDDSEAPDQVDLPEDPKPFEEQDLFIEIEGYVGDGDELKKIKVRSYEDIPEDFNHKDNKAFAKFQKEFTQLVRDQEKQEADRKDHETAEANTRIQNETIRLWQSEQAALRKDGRLPEIKAKPNTPAYKKDPGAIREAQVYGFIVEENTRRAKLGLPVIQSFEDALDKLELREMRQGQTEEQKRNTELKKKQAGQVGKSRPGSPSGNDKPGYVRGSGQSPMDILSDEMMQE